MNPDDPNRAPVEDPGAEPGGPPPGGAAAPPGRSPLSPDGMERPAFLLDFPEDPALEPLIEAFEAGNYARVREDAEKLAAATENVAVRAAALELRRRIEPDPLAKHLLAMSALLLIVLSVWAYRVQAH